MVDRFAACFRDYRRRDLIEHAVRTLIGQRVYGIALGYEDLNDHDQLRRDPLLRRGDADRTLWRRCRGNVGRQFKARLQPSVFA
jgi:hypothetical protein